MRVEKQGRGNHLKRMIDWWIGRPAILLIGVLRRKKSCPREVRRIGILMFGAIGDALLASSIMHDLRRKYPSAKITAVVSVSNSEIMGLLEGPDDTLVAPLGHPMRVIAMLRRRRLDILLDAGQWPRISAIVAALARAKFTVGFKTRGQCRHWAFDAVAEHSAQRHELDNFRALLGGLGIQGCALPRFKSDLLQAARECTTRPYIVLHPWASGYRSHLREWPPSRWIDLAMVLLSSGYRVTITGGARDCGRADALADAIGAEAQIDVLAGRATLRETALKLLGASAVVSVNTGIMHLAALLGRPTIGLHGPTNARRWGPIGRLCTVVGPGPESGCGYLNLGFEYPQSPPDCMARISVEEVVNHLGRILGWAK